MQDPKEEKTLVLIKPDGVRRGLSGGIIQRIEQRGLKVLALGMIEASKAQIDGHYPKNPVWVKRLGEKTLTTYKKYGYDANKELKTEDPAEIGKMVREWLIDFMCSGPIIKIVVKGTHAVDMIRKLSGQTMPSAAETGTIRGDFSVDSAAAANRDKRAVHNIVHASETPEEAEHEIKFWFSPEEIHDYKRAEDDIIL